MTVPRDDRPSGTERPARRQERLEHVIALLADGREVTVAELVEKLSVSSASVRRDLELLEQRRLLVRTHGGAVGAPGVSYELPLRYRSAARVEQKRAIAREAATRVGERAIVGLTGGTTTTEVARALSAGGEITIVTNALNIASEVVVRPTVKLVLTGGVARDRSYELCGPLAERTLGEVHLDLSFVGVDGLSAGAGLTTHDEVEAKTNLVLLQRASTVVVVADSTKLGRAAFARICGLDAIDEVITDDGADPAQVHALREAGVAVTVVPV
ncbi:DeoR/GlpR family DNA-binding transcription regulator [Nocardioides sp. T2.26MG-1]|uniref:DeoR/GlpR family DNA-binding transcription regulator n=1 Tax=Nocardioides sp. T2.26MG-1 TaxID=3041166 RepID=UPI002477BBE6|nr:DeoR/GlpR family DNA-binding transcription regulator [Nocardioides sp. T2.26MG-1]CAI9408707.1 Glycerol-3-phosphate regulon repressor [Nocardioides sp. T2.26MG-1]